jgi:hypothetical protein
MPMWATVLTAGIVTVALYPPSNGPTESDVGADALVVIEPDVLVDDGVAGVVATPPPPHALTTAASTKAEMKIRKPVTR